MISFKKFTIGSILLFLFGAVLIMSITYVIDPYFHYRPPMEGIPYYMSNTSSVNDGIARQFDYDMVIVGTCMIQNIKTTQVDELLQTRSIKLTSGSSTFYENRLSLERTFAYNPSVNFVIRDLGLSMLSRESDAVRAAIEPEYLYDDDAINDINYLLNKEVMLRGLGYTAINLIQGKDMMSLDEYSSNRDQKRSKEITLSYYIRDEETTEKEALFTEEDRNIVHDNIMINVVDLAKEHPEIEFYCFYPPFSILFYDNLNQINQLAREFEIIEYTTSLLVNEKNITLFSFIELYDVVSDLDNYKDAGHYSGEINDLMIEYMHQGEYILTEENYKERLAEAREFYMNYDYDSLFT